MAEKTSKTIVNCYHCGEPCNADIVVFDEKNFCCDGCKVVYELLLENNLCNYYTISKLPGISPKLKNFQGRFSYLEDENTYSKLIRFRDGNDVVVIFDLPQMHCSSCVWLLENLYRMDPGVLSSRTDFLRKEITIRMDLSKTSFRKVVELLTTLGYEPLLNLNSLEENKKVSPQRKRLYRIAVAGFCFANIMLLSFPEYFHIAEEGDMELQKTFAWLNLFLSLPVFFYSAGEFFESAWSGIKARFLNIDIPLVLSILITFGRSLYEIFSGTGAGYLDSMSGIIFFMLVGRYFQEMTHYNLQFDRNYKSFFPISIQIRKEGDTSSVSLPQLKVGDIAVIHSQELIPADSKLLSDVAYIDYSFVTGETNPVRIAKGEIIYAGGKQTGGSIECEVLREVSQSYLTGLWNKDVFNKGEKQQFSFIDKLARNFTIFLLALSVGAFLFWLPTDAYRGLNALTTVLIVACPCALLLSATFTNGAMMRIFSRNKFYLRNPGVIENLAKTTYVAFDKTGTLTQQVSRIHFHGQEANESLLSYAFSAAKHSNHPLSRALATHLAFCDERSVQDFQERAGQGIMAKVDGKIVRLGSAAWCGAENAAIGTSAQVYLSIDGRVEGYFTLDRNFREKVTDVLFAIGQRMKIAFISGDNDGERSDLEKLTGGSTEMHFFLKPEDKLNFVADKQKQGYRVAMIGDGLNDAGALRQSDVGIAVSDDVNNFSPACDAILEGSAFNNLHKLMRLAIVARRIIIASFILSLMYNVVGLSFAVQGELAPVIAAILMPVSSISIILFTTGLSLLSSRRLGLK